MILRLSHRISSVVSGKSVFMWILHVISWNNQHVLMIVLHHDTQWVGSSE